MSTLPPAPASALPILVQVLRKPAQMAGLDLEGWDLLLRQALATNLTASLYCLAKEGGMLGAIPARPRRHLDWAAALLRRHSAGVRWEVERIGAALDKFGLPLILLKGAAYVVADLPAAHGRLFSDIDLLVPRGALPEVESALMRAGWLSHHHDDYDQRYYRQWMHEIPPMQHFQRASVIDVHHTILPLTARAHPDPDKLRRAAVPVAGWAHQRVHTLAPADMVIHSATHLFHDGEFDKGLRDLLDLHRLLVHFGAAPGFWDALPARAAELELSRPLFYALRYSARLLATPVPPAATSALAPAGPGPALLALMDALFERALLPMHASCAPRFSALAHKLLYIRGNWLRMPPPLLARHLWHKAFISPKPAPE